MNLESQVSSLELSRKLRDLGVAQNSIFYWGYIYFEESSGYILKWPLLETHAFARGQLPLGAISAFTVAELYKIHCEINPHASYSFPEGIEPEQLADYIAEEIINEINSKKN